MIKKLSMVFFISTIMLAACQADQSTPPVVDQPPTAGEQTLFVGPFWEVCEGVGPMLCLQVKENLEDSWTNFYDPIEGFTFEPGFSYELNVRQETVENPPADGSSIRWYLVEEVSKSPVEMPQVDLIGTQWNLISNQGSAPVEDSQITLLFDVDQQLGGSTGCNSYFAGYEHQGFGFSITSPIGSTLMACEEPIMNQETEYLSTLEKMDYLQLNNGQLLLVSDDGLFLVYEQVQ